MRADSLPQARLACSLLLTAAALLGCMGDGVAAAATTIGAGQCSFGAFVQEDDPAGLNVRATPSAGGRIVGTLPPSFTSADNPGFKVRIEVDVLGQEGGWFHIAHARDNEQLTGKPARRLVAGDGWVSGRKLTVKSQATSGHVLPDAKSESVLSLGDSDSFDGDAIVGASRLVDCRGSWALIELDPARLPVDVRAQLKVSPAARAGSTDGQPRAWVDQICNMQETTCEGLGGMKPSQ